MRKLISEFLGTFVLVALGCGTVVAANSLLTAMGMYIPLAFTTVTIALAFGLTMTAMFYVFQGVSGGHFNPATSVAVFINGGFEKVSTFIFYLIAQFAGGVAGAAAIWLVTGQNTSLGQTGYSDLSTLYIGIIPAIAVELILTFVFVLVFLAANSKEKRGSGTSLVVGLTFALVNLVGLPFTGAGLNPARSFGPAILVLGDTVKQLPVFILAPVVGAILAALVYKTVIDGKPLVKRKIKKSEEALEEPVEEAE